MNITLGSRIIAANYAPASPPPRGILADWLRASGSRSTTAQLDAALRTGQPVELGPGAWLEWRSEE